MLISTKGRYALRVLLDLAEHASEGYIPMKDVAARQEISLKYIEKIMPVLTKNRFVEGIHGKGGGYHLTKDPDRCTVWEILQAAEGDLAPVTCLLTDAEPCGRAAECRTLGMWEGFYGMMRDYFSSITLADLVKVETVNNYVI